MHYDELVSEMGLVNKEIYVVQQPPKVPVVQTDTQTKRNVQA